MYVTAVITEFTLTQNDSIPASMSNLHFFSNDRVSDEDRREVHKYKEKMRKLRSFELTNSSSSHKHTPKKSDEQKAFRENQMKDLMSLIRTHAVNKRCFMEEAFLEIDRRHLGIIDEDSFWKILNDFGLSQILSDSEKQSIMKKYKKSTKVQAISITGTLSRPAVHYRRFCRDLLPTELLTTKDERALRADRAPEVSSAAKALDTYVRTVQSQKLFQDTETKKRLMLGAKFEMSNIFSSVRGVTSDSGLDPWESNELSRIIQIVESGALDVHIAINPSEALRSSSASASASVKIDDVRRKSVKLTPDEVRRNSVRMEAIDPNVILLSRQQCEHVFKCMSSFKKVPEFGTQHSIDILFQNVSGNDINSGIQSTIFRASVGCPQRVIPTTTSMNIKSEVSIPKPRKGGAIPKTGVQPIVVEIPVNSGVIPNKTMTLSSTFSSMKPISEIDKLFRNPPVRWRNMSDKELSALEGKIFMQSGQLLEKLLRARGDDDFNRLAIETMNLGITATRLGGQKVQKATIKDYHNPYEMIAAASNRSDVIVLPNLKKTMSLTLSCKLPSNVSTSFSSSDDGGYYRENISNSNSNPPKSAPAYLGDNSIQDLDSSFLIESSIFGRTDSSHGRGTRAGNKVDTLSASKNISSGSTTGIGSRSRFKLSGSRPQRDYSSGSGSVSPFKGGSGWAPGTSTLLFG